MQLNSNFQVQHNTTEYNIHCAVQFQYYRIWKILSIYSF